MIEKDTLAAWLFNRYATESPLWGTPWEDIPEDAQSYWEHEANAVRRAVARGGFKEPQ
ncbi:hypothetical protein ACIQHZ_31415 [Streptomyces halstedii]|uniref:hypothetical protein n=1 Tax=Streptomyces halstedii TaxID=1944 RepID=UPI0038109B52